MGKQMTEMLKGTLEGIVLAVLSGQSAYGYEITAWLREQGFTDIAEGTVYALLIRIELARASSTWRKAPGRDAPRKVYTLNAQGRAYLEEFWRTWGFLSDRARTTPRRRQTTMTMLSKMIGEKRRWRQYKARTPAAAQSYRTAIEAVERYLMYLRRGRFDGPGWASMLEDLADLFEQAAANQDPDPSDVGDATLPSSSTRSRRTTPRARGSARRRIGFNAPAPSARAAGEVSDGRGGLPMTPVQEIRVQGLEKSYDELAVLRGATSTWRAAASSPCSARTAQARPRS